MDTPPAVVIDAGSSMTKAGFAGDDVPRALFPTVVGMPRRNAYLGDMPLKDAYVGDEAMSKRGMLDIKRPVREGKVVLFDLIERLWRLTFESELRVAAASQPLLLTLGENSNKTNAERTCQILFESLAVPSLYLALPSVLGLYASGRTTGLVVESGETSFAVPVYEGHALRHNIWQTPLGGGELTERVMWEMITYGYSFTCHASESEIIRDVKEKHCYVLPRKISRPENAKALWPIVNQHPPDAFIRSLKEMSSTTLFQRLPRELLPSIANFTCTSAQYELPDGQMLRLAHIPYAVPEMIFQPGFAARDEHAIHELVYNSIMRCDVDLRKDLFANVILSGGNTMFRGYKTRMFNELSALAPATHLVRVCDPPERKYAAWIGGSILASLSYFEKMTISVDEYSEFGPMVVHRKCF